MKKAFIVLLSCSLVAGLSYLAWAYTPLGKSILSRWLLQRWALLSSKRNGSFDREHVSKELTLLSYKEIELLFFYTREDPMGSKDIASLRKYMPKLAPLFNKADLSSLNNTIFPG